MKRRLQNFLLIIISSSIALGIGEVAVRILVPKERWEFRDASEDWAADSVLGWRQKASYSATSYDMGPEVVSFKTNRDGFRPAEIDPKSIDASTFVVYLVGNSTVNGRMVPNNQTIHYYLDSLLRIKKINPIVVNASVQGYSTDQALMMIEQYAQDYKPDWIIYGFCDNDLGGNVMEEAYGMHKPRFQLDGDELILNPIQAQNVDFSKFREASWKDWIVKSALYRLIKPIQISLSSKYSDPEGQILMGLHGAEYYFDPKKLDQYNWKLLEALLAEMKRTSESIGAQFAFYAHPSIESTWRPQINELEKMRAEKIRPLALESRLSEASDSVAVKYIPMVDYFLGHQEQGPFHLLPKDTHCNGKGYLLQAQVLCEAIMKAEK